MTLLQLLHCQRKKDERRIYIIFIFIISLFSLLTYHYIDSVYISCLLTNSRYLGCVRTVFPKSMDP